MRLAYVTHRSFADLTVTLADEDPSLNTVELISSNASQTLVTKYHLILSNFWHFLVARLLKRKKVLFSGVRHANVSLFC